MLSKLSNGRPPSLPEYEDPPIDEVIFDVQFQPLNDYSVAHGVKFWEDVMASDYPVLTEVVPLHPYFEKFDSAVSGQQNMSPPPFAQGGMGGAIGVPMHPNPRISVRLWFNNPDKAKLVQLQHDRLIFNWRKTTSDSRYLRFDNISTEYYRVLGAFRKYAKEHLNQDVAINHAELKYVNVIAMSDAQQASDWIKISREFGHDEEGFVFDSSEIVYDADSKEANHPIARFYRHIVSGYVREQTPPNDIRKIIELGFSYRGPVTEAVPVESFFSRGRERIVSVFHEMTTDEAHRKWRQK